MLLNSPNMYSCCAEKLGNRIRMIHYRPIVLSETGKKIELVKLKCSTLLF